jgi:hypothetical protein
LTCVKRSPLASATSENQSVEAAGSLVDPANLEVRPVAAACGETARNREQGRRAAARPHVEAGDIIVAMPAPGQPGRVS